MSDPSTERLDRDRARREPGEAKQLSMPVATVGALLVSLLSSVGSGTFVSSRASDAQRERDTRDAEGRVRVEARLEALQGEVRRASEMAATYWTELRAQDRSMDERLRAVELQQARGPTGPR